MRVVEIIGIQEICSPVEHGNVADRLDQMRQERGRAYGFLRQACGGGNAPGLHPDREPTISALADTALADKIAAVDRLARSRGPRVPHVQMIDGKIGANAIGARETRVVDNHRREG